MPLGGRPSFIVLLNVTRGRSQGATFRQLRTTALANMLPLFVALLLFVALYRPPHCCPVVMGTRHVQGIVLIP